MSAALALALAATLAVPFADQAHRFSVDLPPGWTFASPPGDAHGAIFRCSGPGTLINAAVRVIPFTTPVTLAAFAARIAAAADQEPGFRLLEHGTVQLAGVSAMRRRYVVYVNGDRSLSKVVEQRLLVAHGAGGRAGYVLHAETLAPAYPDCAAQFAHFFNSFMLGDGGAPMPAVVSPTAGAMQALAGTWEGGGHKLSLSPAGNVSLDGVEGTYHLDHGVMVLSLTSDQRIFTFRLHGNALDLRGSTFGDGQTLRRSH